MLPSSHSLNAHTLFSYIQRLWLVAQHYAIAAGIVNFDEMEELVFFADDNEMSMVRFRNDDDGFDMPLDIVFDDNRLREVVAEILMQRMQHEYDAYQDYQKLRTRFESPQEIEHGRFTPDS